MLWTGTGILLPSIDTFLEDDSVSAWDSPDGRELRETLLELRQEAFYAYKDGHLPHMDACGKALYEAVERIGYQLAVQPRLARDDATQAGRKKKKKPRNPEVDSWIERRLKRGVDETVEDMWNALPADYEGLMSPHTFGKHVTKIKQKIENAKTK